MEARGRWHIVAGRWARSLDGPGSAGDDMCMSLQRQASGKSGMSVVDNASGQALRKMCPSISDRARVFEKHQVSDTGVALCTTVSSARQSALQTVCAKCVWRNQVLPCEQGSHEVGHEASDMENETEDVREGRARRRDLLRAMHTIPDGIWLRILNTYKLMSGIPFRMGVHDWFKFPLRNMQPWRHCISSHLQTLTESITDSAGFNYYAAHRGFYTVWHQICLEHLVSGHPKSPGSRGVFVDGYMRYGIPHGDGVGVYFYASPPIDNFSPHDGWGMLELRVRPYLRRVQGGSPGRYLIKSDQSAKSHGAWCPDVEVVSLVVMYQNLDEFMKF